MIILYVFLLCTSCVMMKDLDHAYTNKDIQSGLKEMGGLVDTLKFQNDERYTYRIISINARDMVNLSETLLGRPWTPILGARLGNLVNKQRTCTRHHQGVMQMPLRPRIERS